MAFSSADWSINYALKTVTNNDSGTGNNLPATLGTTAKVGTVLAFFQWLATEFASSAQMDDDYAFLSDTPTVYRWTNGWAFGDEVEDVKYLEGGSIESTDANILWSNLYSIGSQESGTQIYLIQNDSEVSPWWITGNVDILVKVKSAGVFIQSVNTANVLTDGGVWLYARETGDLYDHGFADLSGGGRNPLGVNTAADSSNKSGELYITPAAVGAMAAGNFVVGGTSGAIGKIAKIVTGDVYLNSVRGGPFVISETITEYSDRELQTATGESSTNDGTTAFTNVIAGWTDVTDTFGAISRDLNNGNGSRSYDVEIDAGTRPMGEMYEHLKYITRYGSVGATFTVDTDDGQEYRSADEGVYPEVKVSPFGTLAGTTFFGATGVYITNGLDSDFVLLDDTGTEQAPPDLQKVNVNHASLSGTQIFVAEISGGVVIKNQYTILAVTASTIQATTTVNINKAPQSGVVRVGDTEYAYTGFATDTFTGVTPDPTGETGDFYVPLLSVLADATSELSDNIIYSADINVVTTVRKYGFKNYSVDTTFGSNGLSFSPVLTDDPQAT